MNNYKLVKNEEWKEVEINGEDKDIPSFWKLSAIKNIAQEKKKRRITKENDNFCINLEDISQGNGKIISSSTWKENKSIKTVFEKNDILYGKLRPYLKKYWVADKEGLCSTEIIVLSNTQETIPLYLYFLIIEEKFNSYINEKAEGTRMPRARWEDIKSFQLALPPLEQQSAISDILSHQESIISDTESLIFKYESRFQYLSEELLSGRLRVKEVDGQIIFYKNADDNWKEVEVNGEMKEIPIDWKLDKINDLIIENKKSKLKAKDLTNTGQYVAFNCSKKLSYFCNQFLVESKNLFLSTGGLAAIHYYDGKASYSTDVYSISSLKEKISTKFLYLNLNTYIESIDGMFYGAGLKHLNKKEFKNWTINYPLPNEQKSIVEILSKQENLINQQKELLAKEKQKFDWLLDNLLSGKYLVQGQ